MNDFVRIRTKPNGSCLFIALRLGLEVDHLMRLAKASQQCRGCLDGFADEVAASAEELRRMIIQWYRKGITKAVPALGHYTQAVDGVEARPWLRGDILALEMVHNGADVPEEGDGRTECVLRYLRRMAGQGIWGSTPEYTAFAMMSSLAVHVYQPCDEGLTQINTVAPLEPQGTVSLLFVHNHYDLLVPKATAEALADSFTRRPESAE